MDSAMLMGIAWAAGVLLGGYKFGGKTAPKAAIDSAIGKSAAVPDNLVSLLVAVLPIVLQLIGCDTSKFIEPKANAQEVTQDVGFTSPGARLDGDWAGPAGRPLAMSVEQADAQPGPAAGRDTGPAWASAQLVEIGNRGGVYYQDAGGSLGAVDGPPVVLAAIGSAVDCRSGFCGSGRPAAARPRAVFTRSRRPALAGYRAGRPLRNLGVGIARLFCCRR